MLNHKIYNKVILLILDGFGVASPGYGNAISQAKPETINYIVDNYPHVTLQASGTLVGLPWGEMGNSEVGHLNIGAGRTVSQDMPRITKAIASGDFFRNPVLLEMCKYVNTNKSSLHIMGMVSGGGVHSLDQHCYALLGIAKEQGVKNVYIHMFTDGRDTDEKVAIADIEKLEDKISQIGVGQIATVTGRFYAMDRGGHIIQTESTYQAIVNGKGDTAPSAIRAVEQNYDKQIYDEMIPPTVITKMGSDGKTPEPVATVKPNDAVIFFNFRSDRAIQLTRAFVSPETLAPKGEPPLHEKLEPLYFATMTEYHKDLSVHLIFEPFDIIRPLGEVVNNEGLNQFHVAESEKYAHVTSFINGARIEPYSHEERQIVQSPSNVQNYLDKPEMSAQKITDVLLQKLNENFSLYVANFANADMVGHTGNMLAATAAISHIDSQIKRIMDAALAMDACFVITADHGNAEIMLDPATGIIDKDHSTSPVPFLIIANEFKKTNNFVGGYDYLATLVPSGVVSDVAPTVLDLLGLPSSPEMTGVNLLHYL